MQVVKIEDIELMGEQGLSFAFPISSDTGTAASAVVYFELEPGATLATHTDSAEELLYVVAGRAEATVGDEVGTLEAGSIAVVPSMAPHGLRNVGDETVRVVGFFAASTVVSTFAEPWPDGSQVFVIGGPAPIAVPLTEQVAV